MYSLYFSIRSQVTNYDILMKEQTSLWILSGGFANILEEQGQVDVRFKENNFQVLISPNTWIVG